MWCDVIWCWEEKILGLLFVCVCELDMVVYGGLQGEWEMPEREEKDH